MPFSINLTIVLILFCSVIRLCVAKGLNLQTHTPVQSIQKSDKEGYWNVQTPRGQVTAKSVVVATNAYTSGILPEFSTRIIPVRGTVCSITPAPSHTIGSSPGPLKFTYGLRSNPGENDYMICRGGRGRVPVSLLQSSSWLVDLIRDKHRAWGTIPSSWEELTERSRRMWMRGTITYAMMNTYRARRNTSPIT